MSSFADMHDLSPKEILNFMCWCDTMRGEMRHLTPAQFEDYIRSSKAAADYQKYVARCTR